MILAIDIGNTTTSFGLFERSHLTANFSIATQPWRTPDEVTLQIKALAKTHRVHLTRATQIILCSVVPRMSSVLMQSLQPLTVAHTARKPRITLRVVGQDVTVPLKNRYTYPEQVGQDRLVGAYAAWCAFGGGARVEFRGGRKPARGRQAQWRDCIVADFGTAITIDVVTKSGEYLGGIIAPGLEISLDALASKTALLPKVELKEPPELLGRDTANSIRAGIVFGCAALCDGLVTQLKRRYAPQAVVVATGGASSVVGTHATTIDHLRPHLVLEGLQRLAQLSSR